MFEKFRLKRKNETKISKDELEKLHDDVILEEFRIMKEVAHEYGVNFWTLVKFAVWGEANPDWVKFANALLAIEERIKQNPLCCKYKKLKEQFYSKR